MCGLGKLRLLFFPISSFTIHIQILLMVGGWTFFLEDPLVFTKKKLMDNEEIS